MNPHKDRDPIFRDLVLSPFVSEAVQEVCGDEPFFINHSKISYKFFGKNQAWLPHQDNGYKPKPIDGLTLDVFLEEYDTYNGTLEVFPQSHLLGTLPHDRVPVPAALYTHDTIEALPDIRPIPVCAHAGDILFFLPDMIHQSGENSRGDYRCIFIFEVNYWRRFAVDHYGDNSVIINGKLDPLSAWAGPRWWQLQNWLKNHGAS